MLHGRDGQTTGDALEVTVTLSAPADSIIRINGKQAAWKNGLFTASARLSGYENRIEAVDGTTGEKNEITVYYLKNFAGKYRLSIDDNIWFLRDIHRHTDTYHSLFDNPYLAFLKEVNALYGTKVHLNLFFRTDGFDLSEMSDKFRDEWRSNAGWLRLSFHALAEFPDKPYQHAGYEEVKRDCERVMKEIRRFAGEEVMGPMTTLHWGEATVEGSRALRDCGYTAQLGYFNVDDDLPAVSYYLGVQERRHIKRRFIWKDNREGIIFIRSSIVIDKTPLEQIPAYLDGYARRGGLPPYVDLLVHEQYFYPFYEAYQPDYRDRILASVKWADENGYTPAFLSDCIFPG
jgi:hypothetical protein